MKHLAVLIYTDNLEAVSLESIRFFFYCWFETLKTNVSALSYLKFNARSNNLMYQASPTATALTSDKRSLGTVSCIVAFQEQFRNILQVATFKPLNHSMILPSLSIRMQDNIPHNGTNRLLHTTIHIET